MTTTKTSSAGKTADTVDSMAQAGQEAVNQHVEQGMNAFKAHMDDVQGQMARHVEGMTTAQRDAMSAMTAASSALAKGIEEMTRNMVAFQQEAMTANMATMKALASCKSMQDLMAVHNDWARENLEKVMSRHSEMSRFQSDLAQQAFGPLNDHFKEVMGKVWHPAA